MDTKIVLIARLAGRVDRLRDTLTAPRTAVKDKVAEVVGQAVQDVVRETIRTALDRPAPLRLTVLNLLFACSLRIPPRQSSLFCFG